MLVGQVATQDMGGSAAPWSQHSTPSSTQLQGIKVPVTYAKKTGWRDTAYSAGDIAPSPASSVQELSVHVSGSPISAKGHVAALTEIHSPNSSGQTHVSAVGGMHSPISSMMTTDTTAAPSVRSSVSRALLQDDGAGEQSPVSNASARDVVSLQAEGSGHAAVLVGRVPASPLSSFRTNSASATDGGCVLQCEQSLPCFSQELERTIRELERSFGQSDPFDMSDSYADSWDEEDPWAGCNFMETCPMDDMYGQDCSGSSARSLSFTEHMSLGSDGRSSRDLLHSDSSHPCLDMGHSSGSMADTSSGSLAWSSLNPSGHDAMFPLKSSHAGDYAMRADRKRMRPYSPDNTDDDTDGDMERCGSFTGSERTLGGQERSMSLLTIQRKLPKPGRRSSLRLAMGGRRMSAHYAGRFMLKGRDGCEVDGHCEGAMEEEAHSATPLVGQSAPGAASEPAQAQAPAAPAPLVMIPSEPVAVPPPKTPVKKKQGVGRPAKPTAGLCCVQCGTQSTPVWRTGPMGPKTLCNACGVRYMKASKKR